MRKGEGGEREGRGAAQGPPGKAWMRWSGRGGGPAERAGARLLLGEGYLEGRVSETMASQACLYCSAMEGESSQRRFSQLETWAWVV